MKQPRKQQSLFLFFLFLHLTVGKHTRYWLLRLTDAGRVDSIAEGCGLVNLGLVGKLHNVFQFEFKGGEDKPYANITQSLRRYPEVEYVVQEETLKHSPRAFSLPTDPQWKYQWPWYNTGQSGGTAGNDINVVPVWIEGVTGYQTTALVVDNGIQLDHPDLEHNINRSLCYSTVRDSTDINPLTSLSEYNHGTSCAGEISMIHDNGVCGTGVAYSATIAGFQVDFSNFLQSDEVKAFHHFNQVIQVYSNSWGPDDNGYTVQGPQTLTAAALVEGVQSGRNGLGSIYVFSSGNGGQDDDSCAADGYASSRYTIGVGSADQAGRQAFYDEDCSGKMAVTYSYNSDKISDQVVTTYPGSGCVKNFTGTSASAPLLTGVLLLALQVNPHLSWRDVQYLVVYTSQSSSLVDGDFVTNGAGLRVSSKFGFGAINAEALVTRARHWSPVMNDINSTVTIVDTNGFYNYRYSVTKSNTFSHTFNVQSGAIKYLEHVVLTVSFGITVTPGQCYEAESYDTDQSVINHSGPRRGDASIVLCSPSGTCSTLLPKRSKDFVSCAGYEQWPFLSVHFWGENPTGNWTVRMSFSSDTGSAEITLMSLTFYGVERQPEDIVSDCSPVCASRTGCSYGNGTQYCDLCGSGYHRNATTQECVTSCSHGSCLIENTCVFYDGHCPGSGLTETEIIIIVSVCFVAVVFVIVCIVCCVCCLCSSRGKKYRRLHFDEAGSGSYVPYTEPAVV